LETKQKSRNSYQTRTIPFTDTEQLIEDLRSMYPAVTVALIVDLDNRDEEYIPKITRHTINTLRFTTTKTYWRYDKSTSHSFSGSFRYLIAIVEKGTATIKQGKLNMQF